MSIAHMSNAHFQGRKYLVTGAGRGIGRAIVAELHSLGATVYALSKNPENLKSLKEEFPKVITICVDLSDWTGTRKALEPLDAVDCLINNAAVIIPGGFMDMQPKDFDSQINVNLKAVINVSQIIAQKMIDKREGGSIVNISSIAGRKAFPTAVAYGCTKAAIELLTKAMAIELGPHKIRVNSVCPAAVETDMLNQCLKTVNSSSDNADETKSDELLAMIQSRTPTGTVYMPMKDIVNTVLFLASNITSQITGESLAVDGGFITT